MNDNYPVDYFPDFIKNAIYEVQQRTQAPLSLISASCLGAMSYAVQNRIDVCRFDGLQGPPSLYLITEAESGERKSTVDKMLMAPLYQLDEQLLNEYEYSLVKWNNEVELLNIEKKALEKKISAEICRGLDHAETNEKLKRLLEMYPEKPERIKMILNDVTSSAIKDVLCSTWRSVGLMSDEAGTVFNGYALKELPFLNKIWDGSNFSIVRKSEPEKLITDARMTISLMVQPSVFESYKARKGDFAKGVGFFARCLFCKPYSTQGSRQITNPVFSTEHLPVFHQRLMEIVNESIDRIGVKERMCLHFSSEAQRRWIEFYNHTESQMSVFGCLYNYKDYASKIADNMARIAAILHYFNGDEGDISLHITEAAIEITAWHVNEYLRLFAKPEESAQINKDVEELDWWIRNQCSRIGAPYIRKNTILQYGPNRLRNNARVNEILEILYSQNRILVDKRGKTLYIKPVDAFSL
ncbi:TPA: DUF3987 domain-containing protein [Escherichia coli]|uniref:YfjI family protein n=1 Tax=Escherichia coli TaxID=562 RepID=UPI000FB2C8B3|nr:YfjI family protein [Escherichia coli]EEC7712342.1 DUF3987 domain-containing protein [Escherichia coli]EFA6994733.1 DUF3987 domain-containing protein [Escherichia coli]EHQ4455619.1 DUF3987 domain-containing protein [Escherichia coli]EHX7419506.1 DUF3987 domain-containing protein [Escherichia coli]EIG1233740.1 DUF3987 domain-containing protein [Escherichia coli]